MPVIGTLIEPHGVTRVFFDCRNAAPDAADERRVEEAIQSSIVMADAEDPLADAREMFPAEIADCMISWRPVIAGEA